MSRMPGRVEAGRRLVEQQQPRVAQQRRGDAEPLAHAVRVAADLVALRGRSARPTSSTSSIRPRRVAAVERGEQLEVLAAGQVRVEARRLDEAGHAVERARARRTSGSRPNSATCPAVGRISPSIIRSDGRLAGAVRAEVAVDVAGARRSGRRGRRPTMSP